MDSHLEVIFRTLFDHAPGQNSENDHVQGGKKSLSVAIIDKFFYTFDLMEINVKNLSQT